MIMTQQELSEYNKLTSAGKVFYNQYKEMHPGATHAQAMTYAQICTGIEIGGQTTIKEIIQTAVRRAREWIRTQVPRIFNQVRDAIDNLLSRLATALVNTWEAIKVILGDIFD